jgi:hypothetical protein
MCNSSRITYKLSLRAKIKAVVDDFGIRQACELISELTNTGVHNETLEINMS